MRSQPGNHNAAFLADQRLVTTYPDLLAETEASAARRGQFLEYLSTLCVKLTIRSDDTFLRTPIALLCGANQGLGIASLSPRDAIREPDAMRFPTSRLSQENV